ncbi:MAG: transposase [bacterium]
MEHMPCGKFEANAMYFGIGVLTYNLMVAQKHFVIKQGYENKTIQTLRWKLIQVPARIIKTSRYIIFKIETVAEKFNHYLAMIKRIESIAALIV